MAENSTWGRISKDFVQSLGRENSVPPVSSYLIALSVELA